MDIPIHPVAAAFPMLSDDELLDLAADISQRGLIHPIVLDKAGALIDGRNRLVACELADVAPTFTTLPEDEDPVAYIISANLNRRHMGVGQRALLGTEILKTGSNHFSHGKKGTRQRMTARVVGINEDTLSRTRTILKYAPDLIEQVRAGGSIREAWEIASARKLIEEEDEKRLRRLRRTYPDLAARVDAETLTLDEAVKTAELLTRSAKLETSIASIQQDILQYQDDIERMLPLSLDEAVATINPSLLNGQYDTSAVAGDHLEEIAAAIDEAELDRQEERRVRLRVLERFMSFIYGRPPGSLSDDLSIADAGDLVQSLDLVLRWVVAARSAAARVVKEGRLEVIR